MFRRDRHHRPNLPGGKDTALQPLVWEQVSQFVTQQLQQILIWAKHERTSGRLREFNKNFQFWEFILENDINGIGDVRLEDFVLTDWFPRSPGVYFTSSAEQARREASNRTMEYLGSTVYEPEAKVSMIQGGFGSVRFKPTTIEGDTYYLCTATSDGYCHTGIPLAIPSFMVESNFKIFGVPLNLKGVMRYLPREIEKHFDFMQRIPHVYIEIRDIELAHRRHSESGWNVKITPMVFFKSNTELNEISGRKYWMRETDKFATFVTCDSRSQTSLTSATNWIQDYVNLYQGEILSNFDQTRPTFSHVPFSLQNIFSANIDKNLLNEMGVYRVDQLHVTIKELVEEKIVMSEQKINFGENNIYYGQINAIIAERIQNSFNSVDKSDITSDEIKTLLKQLGPHVAKLAAALPTDKGEDVANDYKELVREASKSEPSKRRWEFSIEGLKKAAQNVNEIGQPVIEIAVKIAAILGAMSV